MCIHGLFKKTAPFLVDWEGPAVLELTDWRFTVSLRGLRGEGVPPFVPLAWTNFKLQEDGKARKTTAQVSNIKTTWYSNQNRNQGCRSKIQSFCY